MSGMEKNNELPSSTAPTSTARVSSRQSIPSTAPAKEQKQGQGEGVNPKPKVASVGRMKSTKQEKTIEKSSKPLKSSNAVNVSNNSKGASRSNAQSGVESAKGGRGSVQIPTEGPESMNTNRSASSAVQKSASGLKSRATSAAGGRASISGRILAGSDSGRRDSRSSAGRSSRSGLSRDGTRRKKNTDGKKGDKSGGAPDGEVPEGLPESVVPIFLSSKTQEIFGVKADIDVTENRPYKLLTKESILVDLQNRAAVCDFHPIKPQILEYSGEEILVVYDADFKHGQNFYIALTEEAKELLMKEDEDEGDDILDDVGQIYYAPPVSQEWVSLGSEAEIDEGKVVEHRNPIVMSVKRIRREFGAPCHFSDRDSGDTKDGYIECPPYDDPAFSITRMELEAGVQAIPSVSNTLVQTDWKYPRNAAVQCKAREFTEEQKAEIEASPEYLEFLNNVAPRMELVLQQNEIVDVFSDDWAMLAAEDNSFGSKADNHLKEFQSFTDLQVSKDRMITAIDWHPTIKGIVAVSCSERLSFDERVDAMHRIVMNPSLILVWSFTDPIHPQLLLEAPDDIMCFKFCPTDPSKVAGGCINGQVVLWDISEYTERLKLARAGKVTETAEALPGFEDENVHNRPIVRYSAVSSIEHSHRFSITEIQWVPDHFEINKMGVPIENKTGQCCQLMTSSIDHPSTKKDTYMVKMRAEAMMRKRRTMTTGAPAPVAPRPGVGGGAPGQENLFSKLIRGDLEEEDYLTDDEQLEVLPGSILFWDIRNTRTPQQQAVDDKKNKTSSTLPSVFKHLDLTWKPLLKVTLSKTEAGGDHAPTRFSIAEKQRPVRSLAVQQNLSGDHLNVTVDSIPPTPAPPESSGPLEGGPAGKKVLTNIKTHLYVGSEDGEIIYVNWMPKKDQESGKIQTPKPEYYHSLHDSPIVTLQRSPFFNDLILCVGGWTFSLWKEEVKTSPILRSPNSPKRLTAGHWSTSRPSVFYITRQDGSIDIWDLLDRTHEPCMSQNVSSAAITCIFPYQVASRQHLLALGDNSGTLHILTIPWSLRQPTPNELTGMSNYIDREVKRQAFVASRWEFREQEKAEQDAQAKKRAGFIVERPPTDEEVEIKMKAEYQIYLDEEQVFLRQVSSGTTDMDDF